jgi:class 3 adenylate cyclase
VFTETRYALNGDLRVAYRTSDEGERDIVFVSPPFTNCEDFPELPYIQGWVEAMTSLGRLIFFDQLGTGVSDPATQTLELRADSITAVLDDLGSDEAVLVAIDGTFPESALFAATYPSRTTALVVLEGYADPLRQEARVATALAERTEGPTPEEFAAVAAAIWGTGTIAHLMNSDMPWNEEIRATWARHERLAASPWTFVRMMALSADTDVWALGIEVRAGLHTGECEVRGDDIGGIAVHIGARVSALAGSNDVLVSSTLRDLVIGSGLEFEDRGAHELKGVPGEWRLFAVACP